MGPLELFSFLSTFSNYISDMLLICNTSINSEKFSSFVTHVSQRSRLFSQITVYCHCLFQHVSIFEMHKQIYDVRYVARIAIAQEVSLIARMYFAASASSSFSCVFQHRSLRIGHHHLLYRISRSIFLFVNDHVLENLQYH